MLKFKRNLKINLYLFGNIAYFIKISNNLYIIKFLFIKNLNKVREFKILIKKIINTKNKLIIFKNMIIII